MPRSRTLYSLVVVLVATTTALVATTTALVATTTTLVATTVTTPAGQAGPQGDAVDALIREEMQRQNIPGLSLAILRDDEIVKIEGYGVADRATGVPATAETVYRIASVSKQFIATGVMLLAQEGRLDLDDPIGRFLDDAPDTWSDITLRHLLTHTAGLVREGPAFDAFQRQSDFEVIRSAFSEPLLFAPGERAQYSNLGYFILAEVITRVSGRPWDEYLATEVFEPLGMSTTGTTSPRGSVPEQAVGYQDNDQLEVAPEIAAVRPSGAFFSTVGDLAKWAAALEASDILTETSRRQMGERVTLNDGSTEPWGLGWQVEPMADHRRVYHWGGMIGFRSAFTRYVDEGLTFIVLMNLDDVDLGTLMWRLAQLHLPPEPQEPPPPNVVFILVDDLGYMDVGAFNPETFYETPHIDRLAESGMRLTDAYAAAPVCSPTRASILTGLYPQRVGVTDYIGAPQPADWRRNTRLLGAPYTEQLGLDVPTLAEMLGDEGYATFFAGKWHLGSEPFWPEHQGFDHNLGGIARGGPYGGDRYFSPYGNPRLSDGPPGEHLPARLAQETAAFIEANRDRPFLAYLSFYSVHTPLMTRPDLEAKYEQKRAALGVEVEWGEEDFRRVRRVQEHAVYAGMVEAMDEAVGIVLDSLERWGLEGRTAVIFTSDNGGLSTSEGHPTSNLPLRGGKGWNYEGGIREPTIVRVPGLTAPGSVSDVVMTSPDWVPTILDVAGLTAPEGTVFDGVSLVSALGGEPMDRGPVFWHYPHYGNQGGFPSGAVREGDWKLIENYEDGSHLLFNLRQDLGETDDLSARRPERVREMSAMLEAWRREVGAVMPTINESYDAGAPSGRR